MNSDGLYCHAAKLRQTLSVLGEAPAGGRVTAVRADTTTMNQEAR